MTQTLNRTTPATRQWSRRALAVGLAAAAGLAVWLVSGPVGGIDLIVGTGASARTVGPPSIIFAAVVAGCAAWALLAVLERHVRRGRRVWQVTTWTVLVLSLLGPLSAGASGMVLGALIAMHVAVGATLIAGLAHRGRTVGGPAEADG
jgi:Family of unknown function (DUF6069)